MNGTPTAERVASRGYQLYFLLGVADTEPLVVFPVASGCLGLATVPLILGWAQNELGWIVVR